MLYGTECWAIKKTHACKMEVAKMQMIRWMYGHTKVYQIIKEVIRVRLGVASIADKIGEMGLG